jgi:hypothetical protein
MSNKTSAMMYVGCHRGKGVDVPSHKNHGSMVVQMGRGDLRCRSTEPPPAAEYDAWLLAQRHSGPRGQHGKATVTGEKLRRVVRMIRNGYSKSEAARAVGLSTTCIQKMTKAMPLGLAP